MGQIGEPIRRVHRERTAPESVPMPAQEPVHEPASEPAPSRENEPVPA